MPQKHPKCSSARVAAVKYLETELMPTLEGYHRFQTRVTVNVLNTVRRVARVPAHCIQHIDGDASLEAMIALKRRHQLSFQVNPTAASSRTAAFGILCGIVSPWISL